MVPGMTETMYALDPDSVRLLLRAKVGIGGVLRTDVPETPHTETVFLDLLMRHPHDVDNQTVLVVAMNRGQADVLIRELVVALNDGD